MISLRQHAISLAAVFLALTLGLFLGSGFVGNKMNSLTGTSRDRIGELESERDALNDKVNIANSFDAAIAGRIIADQLRGQSVLVVAAPNAYGGDVSAVNAAITGAGGLVAGQLKLTTQLLADQRSAQLDTIIDQTIPTGARLRAELVDSGGRLGDLLGTLLGKSDGRSSATAADRRTGLQVLRDGGFIQYADDAFRAADLVVVVTGGAFPSDSGAQGQLVARLAAAMAARARGGVLVGRTGSAAGGSPIAVVRSDPTLSAAVSTVDNIDQQVGRITSVLVLNSERSGHTGAYGTGAGAKAITVGASASQGGPAE
ncbi:MAG: copper transporter [Gordonia sp. (in: high G+C Gram-positive bacteria)]